MRGKILYISVILLLTAIALSSFVEMNPRLPLKTKNNLLVSTSFYPLSYFVKRVGGERVEVKTITPNGVEPHDYEPTAYDISLIKKSDIVFVVGSQLEPWANRTRMDKSNHTEYVVFMNQPDIIAQLKNTQDPHIWLDPTIAQHMIRIIEAELEMKDPSNASYYRTNADAIMEELTALNEKYQSQLSRCNKREFITSHAAFHYLAQEYDLTQIAVAGISPDEEPSLQQLAQLEDIAKRKSIKYVFFETLVSPKLATTLADDIGAQSLILNPLEGLTSEQMQKNDNYFTIMEENLNNLRLALECT